MRIQIRSRVLLGMVSVAIHAVILMVGGATTSADTTSSIKEVGQFSVDVFGGPGCGGGAFGDWHVVSTDGMTFRLHKLVRYFEHGVETSRSVRVTTTTNRSFLSMAPMGKSDPHASLKWDFEADTETNKVPAGFTYYVLSRPRGNFKVSNQVATRLVELVWMLNGEQIRIDTLALSVARTPTIGERGSAKVPDIIAPFPKEDAIIIIKQD